MSSAAVLLGSLWVKIDENISMFLSNFTMGINFYDFRFASLDHEADIL